METKNPFLSKLNWIGACLMVIGLLSDPQITSLLGEFVNQAILAKITAAGGLLTIVVRTFFTYMGVSFDKRPS